MSGLIRIPSLLEQSLKSQAANTNEQVKAALEITSFDPAPILLEIADLQAEVSGLETYAELVSTNSEIDLNNLDLSFTQLIAEQCLRADTPVVTGASTTVAGYIEVDINGTTYKLALIS